MVREVLDRSAEDTLKTIPLSNDAISGKIESMLNVIKQAHESSLLLWLQRTFWALWTFIWVQWAYAGTCALLSQLMALPLWQGYWEHLRELQMQPGSIVFLHWEALAAKDMVPVLHESLKGVIQVLNYIGQSAKNTQCFQKLCQDLGSEHVQVLYHAKVCWHSRGKVLSCFYELRYWAGPQSLFVSRLWDSCQEQKHPQFSH